MKVISIKKFIFQYSDIVAVDIIVANCDEGTMPKARSSSKTGVHRGRKKIR